MSKFKEIERRFNIGYAPSVYGTVANARLQMQNDLGELISEFKKLTIPNVSQQREQLHKLLQHISDEGELTGCRTHDQIIDDFYKFM